MGLIQFNPLANSISVSCRIDSKVDTEEFFKVKMVLDTGASRTLISPSVLKLMGYNVEHNFKRYSIICADNVISVPIVKVKRLWLGDEKVEDLEVICHKLPAEARVDGLIGLDCLRRFNLSFNFQKGIIELNRI